MNAQDRTTEYADGSLSSLGLAQACQDIWMGGAGGETLTFGRLRED